MSNDPGVDDAIRTAFAAIRVVLEEHAGVRSGGRERAAQLIEELVARREPRVASFAAMLLAEIAANGLSNYARLLNAPVADVLADYEEHLRVDMDFHSLIAKQYPERPES